MNEIAKPFQASFALPEARGAMSPQPDQARGRMPQIKRYAMVLFRWRKFVLSAIALGVLGAIAVTLLMTPKFTATTTIEIAREPDRIVKIEGLEQGVGTADQEFYQTQYGLLKSRMLAERVARDLKLANQPAFFTLFRDKRTAESFGESGRSTLPQAVRERSAADILLRNVSVDPVRLSRLVDLHFVSPDPQTSARIANSWAQNFIEATLERRFEATAYARRFLEQRLGQLRQRLEESERNLVAYASRQQIINIPGPQSSDGASAERSIVADDLVALSTELTRATADRVRAEAHYRQTGASGASPEALNNSAITGLRQRRAQLAAEYQRLMTHFEPEYPAAKAIASELDQLDRGIAREEGRVNASNGALYRESVERENRLQQQVNNLKHKFIDLRRRSIQYNIYQRDADTNRQLYDALLQRYKEIGVAGGVGANNISVVDPADVPTIRSSPRLSLNLALGLLIGIGLGVAAAFVLEQIDEGIADPHEVERRLGLPLLGVVPKSDRSPSEALQDRRSPLLEAYLSVQTNLAFSSDHGVPRSISVTSTRPGEGKSSTSLALASLLGRSHKKVILIDGDMRAPSVHTLIGESNRIGLSNFLAGDDDLKAMVHRPEGGDFDAMTAGPTPPNAAELLTGERVHVLLKRLLEVYDHVIIDSPPIMGLADAPLIASQVEGVVYAIESHGTRSSMIALALARLTAANARVLGALVTKFEAKRAHYGYGYEYGYGYGHRRDGAEKA